MDIRDAGEDRQVPEEDRTVRSAVAGSAEAFGLLVARYQPLVTAICRRLLGRPEEAADAAQDTFVRAYGNLAQLRDPLRFEAWLRRVAYSVCVNRLKARRGRAQVMSVAEFDAADFPDPEPLPPERAESRELAAAVLRSIRRLPKEDRKSTRLNSSHP
jgi:RNA polymerase sigma-70 factor (ECF subfamily)